jgi:hypothetical protein
MKRTSDQQNWALLSLRDIAPYLRTLALCLICLAVASCKCTSTGGSEGRAEINTDEYDAKEGLRGAKNRIPTFSPATVVARRPYFIRGGGGTKTGFQWTMTTKANLGEVKGFYEGEVADNAEHYMDMADAQEWHYDLGDGAHIEVELEVNSEKGGTTIRISETYAGK